ncbi:hypothetical protein BDN72DRAFT_558117 [Pluteus cervinus]|uniref:Uncharacterized protein n=1 Tax=Pluteus cervinus TaxID=181527 RepID=A0ACD3BAZ0_9AGAR|nr:hypothetical protein BDN72DRAFT_558117 [Pluteus cervinus]
MRYRLEEENPNSLTNGISFGPTFSSSRFDHYQPEVHPRLPPQRPPILITFEVRRANGAGGFQKPRISRSKGEAGPFHRLPTICKFTKSRSVLSSRTYTPYSFFRPALGGLLANPVVRWPDTSGHIDLFRTYPYLLPCGSAGLVAFISYLLVQFGLKETPPSIVARDERLRVDSECAPLLFTVSERDYGAIPASLDSPLLSSTLSESNHTEDSPSSSSSSDDQPLRVPFRALLVPRVLIPLSRYLFLCFTDMYIVILRPLMLSTRSNMMV